MIIDTLANKELTYPVHKGFKQAFDFVEKAIKENLPGGKYEIDGKKIYGIIQEYETKVNPKWECHRKYIDLQMIVSGNEIIKWDHIVNLNTENEYNEEKDCLNFEHREAADLYMSDGMFALLWPQDLHSPGNLSEKVEPVRKVIVKIAVEE